MMDLTEHFGGAFVLNLDSRPDRWEQFQERAAAARITGFARVRAVHGDSCPHPAWWRAGNGSWGCLMSHVRVCQDALMDGLESYVVFEDDAVFAPDFADRLPEIMERLKDTPWDSLALGGQHLWREAGPPWPFCKGVVRCRNVNRTHAFAVNRQFMVKFQQHVLHFPDYVARYIAPDADGKGEWMPHIDHQLGYLHERREHVILAVNPWLCGQAGGKSDINGAEQPEQFWPETGWGQ